MPQKVKIPTDLKQFENEIFTEMNKLRHNPKQWRNELAHMLDYFQGDTYDHPLFGTRHYNKGRKAIEEAMEFLDNCENLPPLERDEGLDLIAKRENHRLVAIEEMDQIKTEQSLAERINAIDNKFKNYAESVVVGFPDVKEIIKDLILHDGIVDHPHREHLLSKDFDRVGINVRVNDMNELSTVASFLRTEPENFWKNEVSKYDLPVSEFPKEYISVRRNFSEKVVNGQKHVDVNYEFTLPNGQKVMKHRTFDE